MVTLKIALLTTGFVCLCAAGLFTLAATIKAWPDMIWPERRWGLGLSLAFFVVAGFILRIAMTIEDAPL